MSPRKARRAATAAAAMDPQTVEETIPNDQKIPETEDSTMLDQEIPDTKLPPDAKALDREGKDAKVPHRGDQRSHSGLAYPPRRRDRPSNRREQEEGSGEMEPRWKVHGQQRSLALLYPGSTRQYAVCCLPL